MAEFGNDAFRSMGMIIDGTAVYIMTANFSRSALGGSSGSTNREYGIIDTNPRDAQAVSAIFTSYWDSTTAQFNHPDLVVSPLNSRNDFNTLFTTAHTTLFTDT